MTRESYIRQFSVSSGMRFSGCQFIAGEPFWDDTCKCSEETIEGLVYCAEHNRLCYAGYPEKRTRKDGVTIWMKWV